MRSCPSCAGSIQDEAIYCKHCKTHLTSQPHAEEANNDGKAKKVIAETKCTCKACGNVWYFGKTDTLTNAGNAMSNVGKSMMCCSGCFPALLIPDKKVVDFNQCPKCQSRAVTKEQVQYEV